jgi:hypothetical protein
MDVGGRSRLREWWTARTVGAIEGCNRVDARVLGTARTVRCAAGGRWAALGDRGDAMRARAGVTERSGVERTGFERTGFERAGIDRTLGTRTGAGPAGGVAAERVDSIATGSATAASAGAGVTTGPASAAGGSGTTGAGGAGSGDATGAGSGAVRGGRTGSSSAGSTYPLGSDATRTPRWTCGARVTPSSLAPTSPTIAPSATVLPRVTAIEPSWSSVTAYPSAVWIVSARPPPGTAPVNETIPAAGARTASPAAAPTSIPRCWPAAYSSSASENGRRTGPSAGQTQPAAAGTTIRDAIAATTATESTRRMKYRLRDVEGNCVHASGAPQRLFNDSA